MDYIIQALGLLLRLNSGKIIKILLLHRHSPVHDWRVLLITLTILFLGSYLQAALRKYRNLQLWDTIQRNSNIRAEIENYENNAIRNGRIPGYLFRMGRSRTELLLRIAPEM